MTLLWAQEAAADANRQKWRVGWAAHTNTYNSIEVASDEKTYLGADLVAALASLDMNDFTHLGSTRINEEQQEK